MHLLVSSPSSVLVDTGDVVSLRASDASGSFGIQLGHADFLTVIPASVVEWRQSDGQWHYCAVRGGVLGVLDGQRIALACREGLLGRDLASLEPKVRSTGLARQEADRRARVEQTRLHAQAVRQLVKFLHPQGHRAVMARQELAET